MTGACSNTVCDAGKVSYRQGADVPYDEPVGCPIGGVGGPFALVIVVGQQFGAQPRARHACAGKEFVERQSRRTLREARWAASAGVNFFLSPEKLYSRKLIEMFIALRIENELTKDQILELYLNKMFLGHRSYGVAAAAEYYYGKRLDQLTVAQCAALASTFQLPSAVNPLTNTQRLIARRNWVLGQMLEHKYISQPQYDEAIKAPDDATPHEQPIQVDAPYLAEMTRLQALDRLGNDALTEGYVVKTTLVSTRQLAAVAALRDGLSIYDHRHGWRGPEAHQELAPGSSEQDYSNLLSSYNDVAGLIPGLVVASSATEASVYLADHQTVKLALAAMDWAHPYINDTRVGAAPKAVDAVLKPGDIIRVIRDDNWQEPGMVAADNLSPHKAAWLLALALTKTRDPDAIQRMFDEY